MYRNSILAWASMLTVLSTASAWTPASTTATDLLAANGLVKLAAYEATHGGTGQCTLDNISIRREWTQMAPSERKAYTNAVLCLQSKPSKFAPGVVPGAKTRYDDFVAVHMNQTLLIHGTANFLSWHRLFTWNYEQALRNECGYQGTQPYWNWGKSAFDPISSPMFDGSDYSMGGNGVFEAHNCTQALPTGANCIPPGPGGGCVQTGPFKNYVVDMGPFSPTLAEPEDTAVPLLAYNPRCLKRDVSPWVSSNWTKDSDTYNLITQSPDILTFQNVMQGNGFPGGFFGVHAGGHYTIGGDPGGDFFASPGDPAFFLHHGMIDRVWWIWQNQDPANRLNAIAGTITFFNQPPGRNGTLTDSLDMFNLGPSSQIAGVMSTLGNPGGPGLCYIYV